MTRHIPQILNNVIGLADLSGIRVGDPGWFEWLDQNKVRSFAYRAGAGHFTARCERKQHGGNYWVAYRKLKGKLYKVYLGKIEELTLEHLVQTAKTLSEPKLKSRASQSAVDPRANESLVHREGLVLTKFYAPVARPDLVSRPMLFERLTLGLKGKMTLICAPAGFGKTTLIAAWRNTSSGQQTPLAWVSLDATDNDPIRFWRYVCASLEGIHPGCARAALILLGGGSTISTDVVLTELLNGLTTLKHKTVLVLDDYHLIDSPAIHQSLSFWLEHLPPQLHLVLLSRAEPPLALNRLRAQAELCELRASELRFTHQETKAYMLAKGLTLSDTDLDILTRRAEGWVVGLQLAALSMQGRQELSSFVNAFAGSHHFIVDYLSNEVFEGQPEEVRSFLLETAILERLCGSLCNAVTEQNHGQDLLERLEASNLFVVSLDDERRWYRYHHLFADFLRTRLEFERPSAVSVLHQKAASWFEKHRSFSDAVRHFQAAEAFSDVARLVEQRLEWSITHGEFQTLQHWLESIPERQARLRLRLYVFRVILAVWAGRLDEAKVWLSKLEVGVEALSQEASTEAQNIRAETETAQVIVLAYSGNLARTIECYERTLERRPPERLVVRLVLAACLSHAYSVAGLPKDGLKTLVEARILATLGGLRGFAMLFHTLEGHMQLSLGRLGQAAWHYREAIREIKDSDEPYPAQAGLAHVGLGKVLVEWNQLSDAIFHLRQSLDLQQHQGNPYVFIQSTLALARIQKAQNDTEAAWQTLELAERVIGHVSQQLALIQAARALLHLQQGHLEESMHWLTASGLGVGDNLLPAREFEYRVLVRVLLGQGQVQSALLLIARLRDMAQTQERLCSVIELLILEALAYQTQQDKTKARTALNRALTLAEPEGFIRIFADEGAPMVTLLSQALKAQRRGNEPTSPGVSLRYLSALLMAAGDARGCETLLPESLSRRELEVLRLLARGLANKGIARELSLAPSTVKWYVNGLFAKLAVHNRTQATVRASSLGLV